MAFCRGLGHANKVNSNVGASLHTYSCYPFDTMAWTTSSEHGSGAIAIVIGKRTKVGIAVPQTFPDGPFEISVIEENLKLIESLGFDSVWTHDQAIGAIQTLDPFVLLAYAARHTTNLKLGISVIVTPYRSPVHLAKSGASLDQISGGRFILGLGIGSDTEVYPAFGITPESRATRFEEQIEVIQGALDPAGGYLQRQVPGPGRGHYRPETFSTAPLPDMDWRTRQAGIGSSRKVRRRLDGCGSLHNC